ncbi:1490_t:CDS:2 [Funneliformis mosseae]|uniref:1490_t:CDS:1 n=1 Tax=Funneliformis mosseae TaxID=27381 RepID=A0A9N9C5D0_FUNMO|nr:1490_t:CDS:2 [Funneliformis mosseae]
MGLFQYSTFRRLHGYRKPFTNPGIPDKYQNLVHDAVDLNPGLQPMFSKRLIDLQHVYKNVRKMSASKEQYEKQTLYKYFDAYDNLVNPKAKLVTFQKEATNYDEDFPDAQLHYAGY